LQFSLQADSPGTFGYNIVYLRFRNVLYPTDSPIQIHHLKPSPRNRNKGKAYTNFLHGYCICDNVYSIGWTIGVLGFDSRWGLGMFLFTTLSRTALGPTQLAMQSVPGALSLGVVKRPASEADHSLPSSTDIKECVELILYSPIRLHGVVLS
jgi:hypothetical protein